MALFFLYFAANVCNMWKSIICEITNEKQNVKISQFKVLTND